MHTQADLQRELETFLGSRKVYFQPPSNVKLEYPCIIYDWARLQTEYANNYIYMHTKAYEVTIIDQKKNSTLPDRFLTAFQYVSFSRAYPADGLWHFVYNLYY